MLVTCTDGRCGDGPGGVKPGEPGHDPAAVVAMRQRELEASCEVLKVSHLELLGYADSGMMGWPNNDAPGAFWTTPVAEAAARLAALIEQLPAGRRRHLRRERLLRPPRPHPGPPDHDGRRRRDRHPGEGLLDHRPALDDGASSARSCASSAPTGTSRSDEPTGPRREIGLPDDEITTWVDTAAFGGQKFDALAAHASQSENIFFLRMGKDASPT